MYDVAVIGAGPAGSTVSRYLARKGMNVCLIDRDNFPRDKPCGGGFSKTILEDFPYLKKRKDDFLQGVAKIGVLHSPNRHIELQGKVDMALTLRVDFDNVLLESAIEQGVEGILGVRAKSIRRGSNSSEITLSNGKTIQSSIVVGADGVSSLVARASELHSRWLPNEITACRVAEVRVKNQEIIERYTEDLHYHFYANPGGLPGYGWIFPKRDTINIGLGIVSSFARGLPNSYIAFIEFLKKRNLLPERVDVSTARGALVPTGGPIKKSFTEGCILVGDSAGMVSPLTGGGIVYAMRAARFASEIIARTIMEEDRNRSNFEQYEKLWRMNFGNDFQDQLIAQKLFTGPFTDLLFEIGSRDQQLQQIVSESMSESSQGKLDVKQLILRTILVCLRGAFKLS